MVRWAGRVKVVCWAGRAKVVCWAGRVKVVCWAGRVKVVRQLPQHCTHVIECGTVQKHVSVTWKNAVLPYIIRQCLYGTCKVLFYHVILDNAYMVRVTCCVTHSAPDGVMHTSVECKVLYYVHVRCSFCHEHVDMHTRDLCVAQCP